MDPYIDLIVDDILSLNSTKVYDAHAGEYFEAKANVLLHVCDYPGQNKVFKSQGITIRVDTIYTCICCTILIYCLICNYCRCWCILGVHILLCARRVLEKAQ